MRVAEHARVVLADADDGGRRGGSGGRRGGAEREQETERGAGQPAGTCGTGHSPQIGVPAEILRVRRRFYRFSAGRADGDPALGERAEPLGDHRRAEQRLELATAQQVDVVGARHAEPPVAAAGGGRQPMGGGQQRVRLDREAEGRRLHPPSPRDPHDLARERLAARGRQVLDHAVRIGEVEGAVGERQPLRRVRLHERPGVVRPRREIHPGDVELGPEGPAGRAGRSRRRRCGWRASRRWCGGRGRGAARAPAPPPPSPAARAGRRAPWRTRRGRRRRGAGGRARR